MWPQHIPKLWAPVGTEPDQPWVPRNPLTAVGYVPSAPGLPFALEA